MKQRYLLLGLIVVLALLLRVIYLGSIPAGFTPDEASQAFSAYSLLKTGKDEWGLSWPVSSFKSFLDYKAPLQTYLMIPTIALFGLNEFATRLPSAIFGTLAVIAIYFLANKLFDEKKFTAGKYRFSVGHIAALFLAISPWHLQFSRMALEVNLASFLFPMGLFFFLEGLEKPKYLLTTAVLWGLSLYTYHAAKVFLPLFALFLVLRYKKVLFKNPRRLYLPALIGFIIVLPLLFGTLFGPAGKRGGDLAITSFSTEDIAKVSKERYYSPLNRLSAVIPQIFHNKGSFTVSKFAENYLSYFSPSFWFTEGGREITYSVIPGRGLLYFWMLPLIVWSLFDLIKNKNKSALNILIPWLLLAAIPAALTKEGYRPNRAGSFALLWEMLAAYGFLAFLQMGFRYGRLIKTAFVAISLTLVLFYFEDYLFSSFTNYPTGMSYGWRETMNFVKSVEANYSKVMIESGNQAQSFVAFYLKYDPVRFRESSSVWDLKITEKEDIKYLDQLVNYDLDKYKFRFMSWPGEQDPEALYVTRPSELLPKNRRILYKVEVPEKVLFEVFDFKDEK